MATLPTLTAYDPNLIPNKATMTDEEFADAIHPYLNFWNGTTIPEINNWSPILEQIRQEINDKYIAVKNQAVDGGYSQAYLDTKYNPPMSRTYYVDAVNGDDVNDGSSNSPFRTLKKAIDSVPDGGIADIWLLSDYDLREDIKIINKNITLRLDAGYSFKTHLVVRSTYKGAYQIHLLNNSIFHIYAKYNSKQILIDDSDKPSDWDSATDHIDGSSFFRVSRGSMLIVNTYANTFIGGVIRIPAKTCFASIGGDGAWYHSSEPGFGVFALNFSPSDSSSYMLCDGVLVSLSGGYGITAVISLFKTRTVRDSNNNSKAWVDVITNIVRDVDGKPRNIISNVVL